MYLYVRGFYFASFYNFLFILEMFRHCDIFFLHFINMYQYVKKEFKKT